MPENEIIYETFKGNKLICIPCGEFKGETQYILIAILYKGNT